MKENRKTFIYALSHKNYVVNKQIIIIGGKTFQLNFWEKNLNIESIGEKPPQLIEKQGGK